MKYQKNIAMNEKQYDKFKDLSSKEILILLEEKILSKATIDLLEKSYKNDLLINQTLKNMYKLFENEE